MSESTTDGAAPGKQRAGAFDVRNFIGALLGLYGLLLLLAQFLDTEEQLAKADGLRVNLWTGLALLATSVAFLAWARWRPILVPAGDRPEDMNPGEGH